MGVYFTDEYTPLLTTTFLLPIQALFDRLQIKSELNSRQYFVLSLLALGAFLGCVHEHVNSVEAEMTLDGAGSFSDGGE